jgi:hypothetical protein
VGQPTLQCGVSHDALADGRRSSGPATSSTGGARQRSCHVPEPASWLVEWCPVDHCWTTAAFWSPVPSDFAEKSTFVSRSPGRSRVRGPRHPTALRRFIFTPTRLDKIRIISHSSTLLSQNPHPMYARCPGHRQAGGVACLTTERFRPWVERTQSRRTHDRWREIPGRPLRSVLIS